MNLSCRILPGSIDVDEPGKFDVSRYIPDDLEMKLKSRLRKALHDKCPKLNECVGARTVLVLEDTDIALTSSGSVGETLRSIVASDKYKIDEVFLVDTKTSTLVLWRIKCDSDWPQIDHTTMCKPQVKLTDITSPKCCPRHRPSPRSQRS